MSKIGTIDRELSELEIQTLFRSRCRIMCPAVEVVAIPNGSRRTEWEKLKAAREGLVAGFPDTMCLWHQRGIAFIEFKKPGGRVRPNQIEAMGRLQARGFPVTVAFSPDEAIQFLRDHGAPFITRENRL